MGLIGKFIFDSTLKIAIKSGAAGKAADVISPKLNKVTNTMTNEEALNDDSFEHHLIVKRMKSNDVKDCYNIFDKNGKKRYIVKRPSKNWKYEIHIYDAKKRKIGAINEHKPFFKKVYEVEERTCSVELYDKYIGEVGKYKSTSGLKFSFKYNNFSVRRNMVNTKTEIVKNEKVACRINRQFATTNSPGTYVISYNNKEYEEAFVIFTIAMDKITSSNY